MTITSVRNAVTGLWESYDDASLSATGRPGISLPVGFGQFVKPKLQAAGSAKAVVACVGDSMSRGFWTSNLDTKGWVGLLQADLQTKWGDGGFGFRGVQDARGSFTEYGVSTLLNGYSAGTLCDTTGTWTTFDGGNAFLYSCGLLSQMPVSGSGAFCDGPGGTLLMNTASHNGAGPYNAGTLTFNGMRGTSVTVAYANASTQAFTVKVDGTTVGTITPTNTNTIATATYTVAAGTHAVLITPSGTAALVGIYGVWATNATGVIVNNYSRQGYASGAFAPDVTTYGHPADWSGGSLDPNPADLIIYSLGGNDDYYDIAPQRFAQNMERTLRASKAAAGKAGAVDVLVVMNHKGNLTANANFSVINSHARNVALAHGAAYVDLWQLYRNNYAYGTSLNYWSDGTASGLPGSDTVHAGDTGHALIYAQIKSNILTPAGLV